MLGLSAKLLLQYSELWFNDIRYMNAKLAEAAVSA